MNYQESLEELESRLLVGRTGEVLHFLKLLADERRSKKIMNLFGTAGVGKSYLLDELKRQAHLRQAATLSLDSEQFWHTPSDFCLHILQALDVYHKGEEQHPSQLLEECIAKLNEKAADQRLVLFLDIYENLDGLDHWLREYFFKRLSANILIVIAGRHPLSEAWLLSPGWRHFISRVPLSHLPYDAVERYAHYCHIFELPIIQEMWRRSNGHPLTLSLLSFNLQLRDQEGNGAFHEEMDTLPFVVSQWLREVPGEHLRPLVEAAAILRHFNQDNLSFLLKREITASEFFQLIRFSFVRKVDSGWTIHSLMRESIAQDMRARTPLHFADLQKRAVHYYYEKFTKSTHSVRTPEALELTFFLGDALIRAFLNWFDPLPKPFESIHTGHREELLEYIRNQRHCPSPKTIKLFDPHTNRHFDFHLTAEQTLYPLNWLDHARLFSLGYDVLRVLRNENGAISALAAVVPINEKTLPYLMEHSGSRSYFTALSKQELERFSVPEHTRAGWFIDTIHQDDYEDVSQHTAIGHMLHGLMFTGEFLLCSPAPFPFFKAAHESLGFDIAEFATHTNYDGVTPTLVFFRDTQGEHLSAYLQKLLKRSGLDADLRLEEEAVPAPAPPASPGIITTLDISMLTAREQEVAALVLEGLTNAEIAGRLYLSEVTVKKHLKSIFDKMDVSNRTQLVKKMLV
ncbi:LuxR C-terminal-related transcriptional regulator [Brevibacillus porteri]|uniref:LuxR C-terminal-related transcriptional regulator n=1 Tax=Brevibacillus porteri TaxID=2126350 RepID=UPI003D193554